MFVGCPIRIEEAKASCLLSILTSTPALIEDIRADDITNDFHIEISEISNHVIYVFMFRVYG